MTVAGRQRRRHRTVHGEPRGDDGVQRRLSRWTTNRRKRAACAPASRGNMHLPLKRIFDEKRRLVIPVLAGLALNVVLFAGVVYPLGVRVRSTEARAAGRRAAAAGGRARRRRGARDRPEARSHRHGTEGVLQGRASVEPRPGAAGHIPAADAARRTAQSRAVAPQHRSQAGKGVLARAAADLDDAAGQLRRHPPLHLSGRIGQRLHRHRQRLACSRAPSRGRR